MKKNPNLKRKKKWNFNLYAIFFGTLLALYSVALLYPIGWGIMNSFKHILEFSDNPSGFPDLSLFSKYPINEDYDNIFGNYIVMFKSMNYRRTVSYYRGLFTKELMTYNVVYEGPGVLGVFFFNSLLIGFCYSVVPAFVACMAGYMCSQYKFKFSNVIYAVVLFTIVTPIVGTTASNLNLMRNLGLFDSIVGTFISCCGFYNIYFLMFYAFFQSQNSAYFEAAEIDGASQFRIMTTIAIPLSKTLILSVIMVLFMNSWNDYNTPLLMLPSYPTVAYGVFINIVNNTQYAWTPYQLAALMLLALPSLLLFIIFKNKLMGNLSLGGVKE